MIDNVNKTNLIAVLSVALVLALLTLEGVVLSRGDDGKCRYMMWPSAIQMIQQ